MLRARLVGGLGWWMGEVLWVMVRQWALVTAWNERRAAQLRRARLRVHGVWGGGYMGTAVFVSWEF